ncbi:MAG: hypothetical protein IPQ18_02985 [Saprospiraceae bacterium]|nr:hypothetical protein [Saprospiraceae bacterium]
MQFLSILYCFILIVIYFSQYVIKKYLLLLFFVQNYNLLKHNNFAKISNIKRKLHFSNPSFSQCGIVGEIFFNNILDPPKWQNYKRENVKAPIQPILQDEIVSSARTKPGM